MPFLKIAAIVAFILTSSFANAQFWEVTSGPPASSTCLVTNSKGYVFAGIESSAVYRSMDNGATWERKDKGIDDGGPYVYPVNQIKVGYNDVLYAAVNGLGILKSVDDGETWKKLNINNIDIVPNARLTVSTKVLPNNRTALFVGYDAGPPNLLLRFSEDDGETFDSIPKNGLPNRYITSIYDVFLSPNSDKMFIAVSYNMGLFRTTNRGQSWRRIENSDTPSGESGDNFLTFAADRSGRIFVGRNALPGSVRTPNAVVMRSSNDGEGWTYLLDGWDNRDITNNKITGIAFGANDDVWTITEKESGTFYSSNGGDSWISRNEGLESNGSGKGIATTLNNHVFVAPLGGQVYRHLMVNSVDEHSASGLGVIRAAPNPASDLFTLSFDTEVRQSVTLQLVSTDGRMVSEYNKIYEPGNQRASIDVSNLPPGIYGWRIISGRGVASGVVPVISH
ncbi:MAG: T9SS type A sorting domain-containing protein [Ignavibacteria bacterium]|nr:T9SS type A sorting domain-containing protein [Ignavibacteria bacterium]